MWYCHATFPKFDHPFLLRHQSSVVYSEWAAYHFTQRWCRWKVVSQGVVGRILRSESYHHPLFASSWLLRGSGSKRDENDDERRTDGWQKAISVMRVSSPYRQWCSCSFSMLLLLRFELLPSVVEGKTGKGCWWWRGLGVDMWRKRRRYGPCFWWL